MADWHLKGKPYEVQTEAIKRSYSKKCWGHVLEMGLGKTAVTYHEFIDYCIQDEVKGMVVICPNALKRNWKTEGEKCGVKAEYFIWPDVPKKLCYRDAKWPIPFVLAVNFEAVGVGKGEEFLEGLFDKYSCMLVVDESIGLKNPKSLRTKACLRLSKHSNVKVKRILTGAPISQGPHDLWAQLMFLDAIPKFSYYAFKNTFCQMGGYMGKAVIGSQNERRLKEILDSVAFRAKKNDWTDLPEKTYQVAPVELTKIQKDMYLDLENDLYTYIEEADQEVSANIVLTKLIKLKQIVSGFVISDDGTVVELDKLTPKLQLTYDLVEQAGKAVIMVEFSKSIELLMEKLKPFNPVCIRGLAHQTADDNEEAKIRFNNDKSVKPIICQIQSGKYGHTLVGSEEGGRCHTSIFYENTYSLDDRKQAEDRIHRWGQQNVCLYWDFVSSPVDERIVIALQKKENIAGRVIDGIREDINARR